jgi:hypothetical protein
MSKVLSQKTNLSVFSTDLFDHGYGMPGINFLHVLAPGMSVASIVTNPPFALGLEFCLRGIWHLETTYPRISCLALLLPVHFMGSSVRYERLFSTRPPQHIIVVSNRMVLEWYDGDVFIKRSSVNFNHAWFVWDTSCNHHSTKMHWGVADPCSTAVQWRKKT